MFDLRRSLQAYKAIDAQEVEHARRLLLFVESQPRCFERALTVGHVTGSAWLVDRSGARVILTHLKSSAGGSSLAAMPTAIRTCWRWLARGRRRVRDHRYRPVSDEIFDVDLHEIPAAASEPEHLHYDVRASPARRRLRASFGVSGDSHALSWIPVDEIHNLTAEESMLRMARKWQMQRASWCSLRQP